MDIVVVIAFAFTFIAGFVAGAFWIWRITQQAFDDFEADAKRGGE